MKYSYLMISLMVVLGLSACSQDNGADSNIIKESTVVEASNSANESSKQSFKATAVTNEEADKFEQIAISTGRSTDSKQATQAKSFFTIYSTTCAKHISNLEEFRDELEDSPKLLDAQAKPFLKGHAGSVWPIPDDHGLFVLSLIEELNMCAVYAREADSHIVQQQFTEMFSEAPSPLVATIRPSTQEKTASGESPTLGYVWNEPGASEKMLFMLTTDSSANAEVQALFTATMIQE
ncbi:MAG: hypothetical protein L0G25_08005 [Psychrobacter sp.]|nr:hypothetical protein [Psychrobacter sp.]